MIQVKFEIQKYKFNKKRSLLQNHRSNVVVHVKIWLSIASYLWNFAKN